jgi:hypothetical protein
VTVCGESCVGNVELVNVPKVTEDDLEKRRFLHDDTNVFYFVCFELKLSDRAATVSNI